MDNFNEIFAMVFMAVFLLGIQIVVQWIVPMRVLREKPLATRILLCLFFGPLITIYVTLKKIWPIALFSLIAK
jgi:hypothetical protein